MTNQKNYDLEKVAQTATDVLLQFDRLPDNPNVKNMKERVKQQLENDGLVTLAVFGCLNWIKSRLFTNKPEAFISDTVRDFDLIMPRVPKIKYTHGLEKRN